MSMYLPNPAVRPTEAETVEFIELPPMVHEGDGDTSTSVLQEGPMVQLSPQTRVDITRRARDCIRELVANYSGDSEDVRSIIHDLHDQITVSGHRRAR
jgi:hypothetical protein